MILPTSYLSPTLLRCSYFTGYTTPLLPYASRTVYEYEFEYYLRSDGGIIVDGKEIPFHAGEMNIRKPGQIVQGIPPYNCYILTADMIGNSKRDFSFWLGQPEESQERYENSLLSSLPDKLVIRKKEMICGLLENILKNQNSNTDLADFQVRSSLFAFLAEIFRESAGQKVSGNTIAVRKSIRFMREHFAEPVSINDLIDFSQLSRSCFHRRFLEETGRTPGEFLASLRIEQARNLLGFTHTPIGEIGALCGYSDPVYFARIFRKETGMSPSAYRSLMQK